tara:strand:+ start:784 stop:927 length:144 start_codon:yes stop_codon:yes gene_type:complete
MDCFKGCCYTTNDGYPFGYCRKCWLANGSPQPVGGGFIDPIGGEDEN